MRQAGGDGAVAHAVSGDGPRGSSVAALLEDLRSGTRQRPAFEPVPTGFHPLDLVLDGGLLPHELVLLGGRPGVGKTLTALQWARGMACGDRPVTFVCYEHDELSLLGRLLVQELAVVGADVDPTSRMEARRTALALTLGRIDAETLRDRFPLVRDAMSSLRSGATGLRLVQASSQWADVSTLSASVDDDLTPGGVLIVDYLQKVPVPGATGLHEQVVRATEALKELAVSRQITVIALAAAGDAGIAARRLRMEHLRGSAALAHDCDVAIVINEKSTATASRHLNYDLLKFEASKNKLIFSVEKNRRGDSNVHLEFDKDFANFRVNPSGGFAMDALLEAEESGDR